MSGMNLTGKRFTRLLVIKPAKSHDNQKRWHCKCDCGNQVEVEQGHLRKGDTRSCSCLQRELLSKRRRTHGHAKPGLITSVYSVWCHMIARCTNPNATAFKWYGGRGVTVCNRWRYSFENFLADMGKPKKGMVIDRRNNDLGYFPKNCRWVTYKESNRNRRDNRLLTWGDRTQCLAAWAEELGLPYNCLYLRLYHGWPIERALLTPYQCNKRRA